MGMKAKVCGDSGGRTKNGIPCTVPFGLSEKNGLCFTHDPERKARRKATSIGGGKAAGVATRKARAAGPESMPKKLPETLELVSTWLKWTTQAVACGEISPRVAQEIVRGCKEQREALKDLHLERRVKELEAQLKAAKAKARA